MLQLLPIGYAVSYFFILPQQDMHQQRQSSYAPLAAEDQDEDVDEPARPTAGDEESSQAHESGGAVRLSLSTKFDIAKPLLTRFMLPLFLVYLA